MTRQIAIAALQLDVAPAPLTERLARAAKLAAQAVQAGAQLIVLPEVFNTGYIYRDDNFTRAESLESPTAAWMKQTSARLKVHLAGSFLLREGREIYNALLLFTPDGRAWRYDKNYPWGWERAYFRPRRGVTMAETDLGVIGMLICWDMAHTDLWRRYAGKVDLMLACSCPPNLSDPIYHFPDGSQTTLAQMGPLFGRLKHSARQVFMETPAQQTAWLGAPFVSSTACGVFHSPIPNPVGSLLGLLLSAPWLIHRLPQIKQATVKAPMVEAARILSADGSLLAGLYNAQGEAFALAEVNLPAERPQPHAPQPPPPTPRLAYLVSDILLTSISRGTYARRNSSR